MSGAGGATIILNQSSRGASAARPGIIEDACARQGLGARVVRVVHADLLAAAERAAEDTDVLIAAGGDGTVSTVAGVAVRTGATFGVLPLGTRNHFARDVRIPLDLERAVEVIAAGVMRPLDVGDAGGRTFVNNASLGMYPRMVWERQIEEARGRGRWTAFAIALARSWRAYRTMTVRMMIDRVPHVRRTPFVFVGNGDYQVDGLEVGKRPSLDAGRLSIFLAPECDRFEALALPFRALARRLPSDGTFEAFAATDVSIETDRRRASVALDGEIMLANAPLRFTVRPGVLRTLVPGAD